MRGHNKSEEVMTMVSAWLLIPAMMFGAMVAFLFIALVDISREDRRK